jgi:hypothetical protein
VSRPVPARLSASWLAKAAVSLLSRLELDSTAPELEWNLWAAYPRHAARAGTESKGARRANLTEPCAQPMPQRQLARQAVGHDRVSLPAGKQIVTDSVQSVTQRQ